MGLELSCLLMSGQCYHFSHPIVLCLICRYCFHPFCFDTCIVCHNQEIYIVKKFILLILCIQLTDAVLEDVHCKYK
jgi:hypothetical protein